MTAPSATVVGVSSRRVQLAVSWPSRARNASSMESRRWFGRPRAVQLPRLPYLSPARRWRRHLAGPRTRARPPPLQQLRSHPPRQAPPPLPLRSPSIASRPPRFRFWPSSFGWSSPVVRPWRRSRWHRISSSAGARDRSRCSSIHSSTRDSPADTASSGGGRRATGPSPILPAAAAPGSAPTAASPPRRSPRARPSRWSLGATRCGWARSPSGSRRYRDRSTLHPSQRRLPLRALAAAQRGHGGAGRGLRARRRIRDHVGSGGRGRSVSGGGAGWPRGPRGRRPGQRAGGGTAGGDRGAVVGWLLGGGSGGRPHRDPDERASRALRDETRTTFPRRLRHHLYGAAHGEGCLPLAARRRYPLLSPA